MEDRKRREKGTQSRPQPTLDEIKRGLASRSNAYSEKTKHMEHKEYDPAYQNLKFGSVNTDPSAFAEIDARYKAGIAEVEERLRASRGR